MSATTASFQLSEEQLLCGICLDVFVDPVTLLCGHNFCKACITENWDTNIRCECPTCKYPFYKKMDLHVNKFIAEMATQFRLLAGQNSSGPELKPGEVPCDICTDSIKPALKSCLVCLASYCETHLEPHLSAPRLKKHQLSEPMDNLEGRMCRMHDKPLELFCRTDQVCVCMLCPLLDHKSHEVVPLKEQFERKKSELGRKEAEIHRLIQERRTKIQEIQHLVMRSKERADKEMKDGVQVFSAMIQNFERAQAELIGSIEEKRKAIEDQAGDYIQQLEEEISELLRRRADSESLSRSKDSLHFLQAFSSLEAFSASRDWSEVRVDEPLFEGMAKAAVLQMKESLGTNMKELLRKAELGRVQQAAVEVTFDPNTAHSALVLSGRGTKVHHDAVKKKLPDIAERFNPSCCVLGRQGFSSGKFYFEVGVAGKSRWTLGVAKQSIKRKGIVPLCPENGHWTIWLKNGDEYAALVGSPLPLSPGSPPETIGVFVDYDDGLVSFYDADSADLLHSFTGCNFTEKLYPFFSPGLNNDGANAAPLVITPVGGSTTSRLI
ncbi:E3 ubiquitin-protein ligase TRIM21-like [Salarias fasciatus]|uniref:E3 ubiquitin-protein ligase TRIM21-like n=1 Tax=Salarias fasciatus TaxID=181472 RepID=A0A672F5N6_SALFA|nr:E3 ubiquitin-protein ligase TRIM21-like [Salarias fasciatus]